MHLIRLAEARDLPAITDIYAEAVRLSLATWDDVAPDLAAMTARYTERTGEGYPYFVAEAPTGSVVGYACGSAFHPQTGWRYTLEDSIYVANDTRRLGVGRQLLMALIEEASARGFRQMIAGISMPGGDGSVALHQALGFSKVGEFPNTGWKRGRWLSAVYLQRALGEGAQIPAP